MAVHAAGDQNEEVPPQASLPFLPTSLKGSGQGCPLLRASNEHIPIVRVLRARRAPGRSPAHFFSILARDPYAGNTSSNPAAALHTSAHRRGLWALLGVVFGQDPYLGGLRNEHLGWLGLFSLLLLKTLAIPLIFFAILDALHSHQSPAPPRNQADRDLPHQCLGRHGDRPHDHEHVAAGPGLVRPYGPVGYRSDSKPSAGDSAQQVANRRPDSLE